MSKAENKVLLVDDDTLLRELLGLIVEKHGYILSKAENGQDAIDQVKTYKPDLIVLDVMMPVMDGREFLAWLKSQTEIAPRVLVLTSMTDEKLHRELYSLGASKVATKPISMRVLEREIDALLDNSPLLFQAK